MNETFTPEPFFAGATLNNVETFAHLGTVFDSKLSWKKHAEYLIDRVVKRPLVLKRLAGCLWGCVRSPIFYLLL